MMSRSTGRRLTKMVTKTATEQYLPVICGTISTPSPLFPRQLLENKVCLNAITKGATTMAASPDLRELEPTGRRRVLPTENALFEGTLRIPITMLVPEKMRNAPTGDSVTPKMAFVNALKVTPENPALCKRYWCKRPCRPHNQKPPVLSALIGRS